MGSAIFNLAQNDNPEQSIVNWFIARTCTDSIAAMCYTLVRGGFTNPCPYPYAFLDLAVPGVGGFVIVAMILAGIFSSLVSYSWSLTMGCKK
ncbi:MAG: hypothetical protein ACTSU9_17325 [Promethearchaeota archaeon]